LLEVQKQQATAQQQQDELIDKLSLYLNDSNHK